MLYGLRDILKVEGVALSFSREDVRVFHVKQGSFGLRRTMPQTRVISITNQKGGVGKTTTAINLASALGRAGRRILLVDLDCQGNATSGLGLKAVKDTPSTYDLLLDPTYDPFEHPLQTRESGVRLVPANSDLVGIERKMEDINRHFYLMDALRPVRENGSRVESRLLGENDKDGYDYVVIDCPPALETLTINAMIASDSLLVPVQAEYYALEGMTDLFQTYAAVRDRFNPGLLLEGILITMADSRTRLSVEVESELRKHYGQLVFNAVVPRSVRFGEAPSFSQSIFQYAPESKGAEAYANLAKEILHHVTERPRPGTHVPPRREEHRPLAPEPPESRPSPDDGPDRQDFGESPPATSTI